MSQKSIKCLCGKESEEKLFIKHIKGCELFLKKFTSFDYKIASLLQEYLRDIKNIYIVKFLFKTYIKLINHKIKRCEKNLNNNLYNKNEVAQDNSSDSDTNTDNSKELDLSYNYNYKNKNKNKYKKFKSHKEINYVNNDSMFSGDKNQSSKELKKSKKEKLKSKSNLKHSKKNKDNINNGLYKINFKKCKERLPCGHPCLGVENEISCPTCLEKNCEDNTGTPKQSKGSKCHICLKRLDTSPIVYLSCSHYVHCLCIQNKLIQNINLYGKKLNFNFMKCQLCNTFYECPFLPELQNQIEKYTIIYKQTQEMIKQRFLIEDIQPTEKNKDIFMFFLCYKCKRPYYVGKNNDKNQIIVLNENNNNEKDCLCGKDSYIDDENRGVICQKHRNDFIEYKCRYCCNMASRFQSQTHLCEECYFNKPKIKECDKTICLFGGIHPPNGIEFCLGCFACKVENIKK